MTRGLWVTFEGGDGTGKTTQASLLERWLRDQGRTVLRTREPGGTEVGVLIRDIVLHHRGEVAPRAEALLYAADRAQHVATLVRPALDRGEVVIQDRYLDSSVAYQGAGRVLDADQVRELSLWATEDALPDVTVLLDLDPAAARRRLDAADKPFDRLEAEKAEFHDRVRVAFLSLAAADPQRFLVLDAALPAAELAAAIQTHIAHHLA
ncbi:dTMP kinase [Microbacterium hominis]|uniref:dTMP kinase n=1 Tax=Microbacterium TaxID=33882 RepID=UPI00168B68DA|nr:MULTISPECIES: dTMP kinase [Microbacterium]QOC24710.1 dTMP kinase [Microbacterium hominis]QOC28767.1 dTMP kinase [Microbacterium hominis]QYF98990.1 dTMP kinase [Microbacterium sp. PAMC21962]